MLHKTLAVVALLSSSTGEAFLPPTAGAMIQHRANAATSRTLLTPLDAAPTMVIY
jgi:hypothetical protein